MIILLYRTTEPSNSITKIIPNVENYSRDFLNSTPTKTLANDHTSAAPPRIRTSTAVYNHDHPACSISPSISLSIQLGPHFSGYTIARVSLPWRLSLLRLRLSASVWPSVRPAGIRERLWKTTRRRAPASSLVQREPARLAAIGLSPRGLLNY